MKREDIPSVASHLTLLAVLLVLLLISAIQPALSTGGYGWWLGIGTAIIQACLVLITFMRLKYETSTLRIIAIVGFAWPFILVVMTFGDYLTRAAVQAW